MKKIKLFSAEKKMSIEGDDAELYIRFYLVLNKEYIFTFLINAPNLSCSGRHPIKLWKHFWLIYQEEYVKYLRRYEKGRAETIDEYKWISVSDKMPSDCNEDWVLVLPYDGDFRCIPTVAEYRDGHWYGHTFCTEDDCIDGEDSPFEVKFWRPIYDEFQIAYVQQLKEQGAE